MVDQRVVEYKSKWLECLRNAGFHMIPLYGVCADGECSCGKKDCPAPGKHPMKKNWENTKYFDGGEGDRQFWQRHPDANYGISTKGFVVIDVDAKNGGVIQYQKHIEPLLKGIRTLTINSGTGNGSQHVYFRCNEAIFKNAVGILPGIDIRSSGGYVVGPGSSHKSGNLYLPKDVGSDTNQIQIAELPSVFKGISS